MNKTTKQFVNFSIILTLISFAFATGTIAQTDNTSTKAKDDIVLEQVKAKYVCMITDKVFQEKQIPVHIEGKTYYGCCQNCVRKLNNKTKTRFAVDPVSGEKINKAKAVIGALPNGRIYYFESVENMRKFVPKKKNNETHTHKKHQM